MFVSASFRTLDDYNYIGPLSSFHVEVDEIWKDKDFNIEADTTMRDLQDDVFSVVQDNISNDFYKLNTNTEGERFDRQFPVN